MTIAMNVVNAVRYTKTSGEVSDRKIIPVVIAENTKAIDVTDVDGVRAEFLSSTVKDYQDYLTFKKNQVMTFEQWADISGVPANEVTEADYQAFLNLPVNKPMSFEQWADNSGIVLGDIKWRTFKTVGLSSI